MLIRTHRDFRRLWAADSLSAVGTQVSALAVPLAAVVVLHAGVLQVGLLTAVESLPLLLIGLPAGAWIDRHRRRPVLVATDAVRAVALGAVPIAALAHSLTLALLYAVAFVVGAAGLLFDVAYQAYLPTLLEPEHRSEANGQLQTVQSVAYFAGPGIAGVLVAWLTAPIAVAADALSFVWSAAWLSVIRRPEEAPAPSGRPGLRREIAAGMRCITGDPLLRGLTGYNASAVLFLSVERAIQVLFLVRVVRIGPATIGLVSSLAAIGAIGGGLISRRLIDRFGEVRAMFVAAGFGNPFLLLVPLSAPGTRIVLFSIGVGVTSCGIVAFNVAAMTYRQKTVPAHLMGRVAATSRVTTWCLLPVGALAGGLLGSALGLRPTMWLAAVGLLAAVLWLLPLRTAADRAVSAVPPARIPTSS